MTFLDALTASLPLLVVSVAFVATGWTWAKLGPNARPPARDNWCVFVAIAAGARSGRSLYAAGLSRREARRLARRLRFYDQVIAAWVARDDADA